MYAGPLGGGAKPHRVFVATGGEEMFGNSAPLTSLPTSLAVQEYRSFTSTLVLAPSSCMTTGSLLTSGVCSWCLASSERTTHTRWGGTAGGNRGWSARWLSSGCRGRDSSSWSPWQAWRQQHLQCGGKGRVREGDCWVRFGSVWRWTAWERPTTYLYEICWKLALGARHCCIHSCSTLSVPTL